MTHIMVPDGVFPVWLWGLGWVVTIAVVGLVVLRTDREGIVRKVPMIGVMAALMDIGAVGLWPTHYRSRLAHVWSSGCQRHCADSRPGVSHVPPFYAAGAWKTLYRRAYHIYWFMNRLARGLILHK